MIRLLLLSQDRALAAQLGRFLKSRFEFKTLQPQRQSEVEAISAARLALVICDLAGLPFDGLAACRTLHEQPFMDKVPCLFLVGENELERLKASRIAEEFIIKPVRESELMCRVDRLLWQTQQINKDQQIIQGNLRMDLARYEVRVGLMLASLTLKEYELLKFLATHPGQVISRERLLQNVWGSDFYGGERTVDVHIRRLRSKIEIGDEIYIQTFRGVGYKFLDQKELRNGG